MEGTYASFSWSPHNPIMVVVGGGVSPPPLPPPIRTMTILTPTTLSSGLIPLTTSTIVPFTQNMLGAPFSYGMSVLT